MKIQGGIYKITFLYFYTFFFTDFTLSQISYNYKFISFRINEMFFYFTFYSDQT